MRVLHVTEALGGGVQSAIANYIDHLPEIEHAVYSRARDGQSTYSWSGPVEHERYAGGLGGFFVRLVRKVRQERPDIVHLHSSFAGAARAVLPPGTAVVYSPHCYAMERRDLGAVPRAGFAAVEWLLARRTRAVVAVSEREAALSRQLRARVGRGRRDACRRRVRERSRARWWPAGCAPAGPLGRRGPSPAAPRPMDTSPQ